MIVPALVLAAVVSLGDAETFSLLARSGVTATGNMRVTGNVSAPASGVAPASGSVTSGDNALKDAAKAWNALMSTAPLTTSLPDALIIDPGATVRHVDGADSSHIFWLVNGSARLRAGGTLIGTLIVTSNITVEKGVTVAGRLIALQGSITLTTDDINLCCNPDDGTPHTFSLFDGTIPDGVTLNADGTLSGQPSKPGTYTFIVLAEDFFGCSRIETRTVTCGPTTISPDVLPTAFVGSPYHATIEADGSHVFTSTDLPTWLSLTDACGPSAMLTGTPTAEAEEVFTIKATECGGTCAGSGATYTLHVLCPAIAIVPDVLDDGVVGTPYQGMVHAEGGTAPYRYDASLPATIDQTGRVSLPVDAEATHVFSVRATDVHGCVGTQTYRVRIRCPEIVFSPASLPDGVLNQVYHASFDGPYTFTSPDLPSWLAPIAGHELTGPPTVPGDYTFTICASFLTCTAECRTYTIHVPPCPVITISPSTLSRGTQFVSYGPKTITVSGCDDCSIKVTGKVPPGLSQPLTISGIPNTVGVYTFTVTATDAHGCFAAQTYTIAIAPPSVPGAIVPVLSPWALLMLSIVLATLALRRMR